MLLTYLEILLEFGEATHPNKKIIVLILNHKGFKNVKYKVFVWEVLRELVKNDINCSVKG